jgi:plasmid stabilization system protein ParE
VKPAEFHPEVEAEFAEIVAFYDAESPGLGDEFAAAVEVAVGFVSTQPEAGRPLRGKLRRWLVRRFPYALIYREEAERVYILAIAHFRRRPRYWQHRT